MYSDKIKEIRTALNLSRRKMSEQIDIPERTIVTYEEGREPSIKFLTQLCKVYKVNANWFITGEGKMFNKTEPSTSDIASLVSDLIDLKLKEKGL